MQIGESRYEPEHADFERYVHDLDPYYDRARLIISHGGFSTLEVIHKNKPLIVVPRQAKYGEHFDDHQVDFARILHDRYGVAYYLDEIEITSEVLTNPITPRPYDEKSIRSFRQGFQELLQTQAHSKPRRVRHNAYASMFGSIVANIANFLIGILIIAALGEAAHGLFSIVLSLITMASVLTLSGLMEADGVRSIARERGGSNGSLLQSRIDQAIGTGLLAGVLLGCVLFLMAEPIADYLDADIAGLIRFSATWPLGLALLRVGMMVCDGFERMRHTASCLVVFHLSRLFWLALAYGLGLSLADVFLGWAVVMPAAGVLCVLIGAMVLRQQHLRLRLSLPAPSQAIRRYARVTPLTLIRSTAVILPSLAALLAAYAGATKPQVSYLMVCYGLASIPMIFSFAITNAAFPAMARMIAADKEKSKRIHHDARRLLRRSLFAIVSIHLLAALGFLLLGKLVLGLLYGSNYAEQLPVLLILALAVGIEAARHLVDHLLIAAESTRMVFLFELFRYALLSGLVLWVLDTPDPVSLSIAIGLTALLSLCLRPMILWRMNRTVQDAGT